MAILKAQLLTAVNKALEREETDIDYEINRVLFKVSNSALFLADVDDSQTIDEDLNRVDVPSYYKQLDQIRIQNPTTLNFTSPLTEISYQDYLNVSALRQRGIPTQFAVSNHQIYFYPKPLIELIVRIDYFQIHPPTPDDIIFDDRFLNVLQSGSIYEVSFSFGLKEQIKMWGQRYADDLNDVRKYSFSPTYITSFNTLL